KRWAAVDDRIAQQRLTHRPLPDDHRLGRQQAVAVGVVTVLVRVAGPTHGRPTGDASESVEEPPGAGLGGTGVHHQDPVVALDRPRVVHPPGAIGLHPRMNPLDDLDQRGPLRAGTFPHAVLLASVRCQSSSVVTVITVGKAEADLWSDLVALALLGFPTQPPISKDRPCLAPSVGREGASR